MAGKKRIKFKWVIIAIIGIFIVYKLWQYYMGYKYLVIGEKVVKNTMTIDETFSEIIKLESNKEYDTAYALAKWIVENAKTSDDKVWGYVWLSKIGENIKNPMMEEYYIDLALKCIDNKTTLSTKKSAYFYKGRAVYDKMWLLGELSRKDEAIYWLEKSLKIDDPTTPEQTRQINIYAHYFLALGYIETFTKDVKKALGHMTKVLELTKDDPDPINQLYYKQILALQDSIYYELNMKDKIKELYEIWKKNYPDYKPQLYEASFFNELAQGNYKKAREIIENYKEYIDQNYLLFYYYKALNDIPNARKALIELVKSDPDTYTSPDIQEKLGQVGVSKEERKELENLWRKWVEENRKKCLTTNVLPGDEEIAKRGWK